MNSSSKTSPSKAPRRGQFPARLVSQTRRGPEHRALVLELTGEGAAAFGQAQPGQFVQVACRTLENPRAAAPLLRRPFSLAGVSTNAAELESALRTVEHSAAGPDAVYIQVVYRILGPGTSWLAHRKGGEMLDVLGPLGHGFRLPQDPQKPALLVGGGVGLPPLFFLADRMVAAGQGQRLAVAGGRNEAALVCGLELSAGDPEQPLTGAAVITEFNRSKTAAIIATDDGTIGYGGNAVQALGAFLDANAGFAEAEIFACGPEVMLKAAAQLAQQRGMACQVCMESYMACGIGVCQSCVVRMKHQDPQADASTPNYKLTCSHGPVFDAGEVDWDGQGETK